MKTTSKVSVCFVRSSINISNVDRQVAPVFAIKRHVTLNSVSSALTNCPLSASLCVCTPTPAADESPTINSRNSGPIPLLPSRGPIASGKDSARRRTPIACTKITGKRKGRKRISRGSMRVYSFVSRLRRARISGPIRRLVPVSVRVRVRRTGVFSEEFPRPSRKTM